MRRLYLTLLVLLLASMGLWATGTQEEAEGGPPVITYVYITHGEEVIGTDTPWMQAVDEAAHVKIELTVIPQSAANEKRNLILASGDIPDMMEVTDSIANTYGREGVFAPVNNLLAQYAPHITEVLDYKEVYPYLNDDDQLYFIPRNFPLAATIEYSGAYREDILDELGFEEPTTMDGWLEVYRAVKANTDMIPMSIATWWALEMPNILSAFDLGLVHREWCVLGSEYMAGKRKVYYMPTTDQWKANLAYLNTMYEEGLLDQGYMTHQYQEWWDNKILPGTLFADWSMNWWRAGEAESFAHKAGETDVVWTTGNILETPGGGKHYFWSFRNWISDGIGFSADSKVLKEAVQFVDWFFTEEGMRYHGNGLEGVTYRLDGDKIIRLPEGDIGAFNDKMRSIGRLSQIPTRQEFNPDNPNMPWQFRDHYERCPADVYGVFIPTLRPTGAETDEIDGFYADLDSYEKTMRNKFITGQASLEDDWDEYVATCNELGAARGTELVQQMMDRFAAFE